MVVMKGGGSAATAVERRAADVAVVGSGASALAAAYALARRGKKVALVAPPSSSPSSSSSSSSSSRQPRLLLPSTVPLKAPCASPLRASLAVEAAAYWRGLERAAADARLLAAAPSLDVFLLAPSGAGQQGGGGGDGDNNATLTAAACRSAGLRAALLRPEEVAARMPGGRAARLPASAECVLSPEGGGVLLLRSAREALRALAQRAGVMMPEGAVLDGWRERGGGSTFELRCVCSPGGAAAGGNIVGGGAGGPPPLFFVEAETIVAVVSAGELAEDFGLGLEGVEFGAGLVGRWPAGDGADAASGQVPVWEAFSQSSPSSPAARDEAPPPPSWLWGMPAVSPEGTVAVGSGICPRTAGGAATTEEEEAQQEAAAMDAEERRAALKAGRRAERRQRGDLRARAGALFRGLVAGDGTGAASGASVNTGRLRGAALLLDDAAAADGGSSEDDDDERDEEGDDGDGGNGGDNDAARRRAQARERWRPLDPVLLVPGAPGAVGFHPAFEPGRFVVVLEAASREAALAGGGGGGCMAFGAGAQMAPLLAARAAELVVGLGASDSDAASVSLPALAASSASAAASAEPGGARQQSERQQEKRRQQERREDEDQREQARQQERQKQQQHPLALQRPGLSPRAVPEAIARAWDPQEARRSARRGTAAQRGERREAAEDAAEERRRQKAS